MKDVRGPFDSRIARRNVGDPGVLSRVAWRAPVLWRTLAEFVLWKEEDNGRPRGGAE